MSGTKILWGQILVVGLLALAGVWLATEWTAWRLGFQPQLGPAWFYLGRWPIYPPPAFFFWWFVYEAYAPGVFARGAFMAAGGTVAAIFVAIGMSIWRAREAKKVTTYGSARWATEGDAKVAGLLGPDGVVLGRLGEHYLRHDGPEHVLCFAPTRSGKGVGLVVPSLLTWAGSAVIHDIKGENWQLTAGFRAKIGPVLLFDPTNPQSSAYNPLLEVRKGATEVRDVQNIADILVDPDGALERRSHWDKTSHSLLVGAILHVLYAEPDKTLTGVANFLADPRRTIEATLRAMMATPHLGDRVHPVVASAARELLNKSENERSGVLSTAMSFLGLYRDPIVSAVTARCDWRIDDLVTPGRPVSLYLVVPPSDISRTRPLIRLILNQIGRRLTEGLETARHRPQLLMMLDEFPALGRLDFFEQSMAFMAGYRIKAFLIAQSLNQIAKAYGENNSILDNCHVRVAFSTNDERTARRISDSLGTATEMRAMKNYAGHRLSPWLGHLMVSRQETARPLLTPGEVMQLPADEAIVQVSGVAPIRAKKARYYVDRELAARIAPPPDKPAILLPAEVSEWVSTIVAKSAPEKGHGDVDDEGGLKIEPELDPPETIIPVEPAEVELDLDLESDDGVQAEQSRRFRAAARIAALDPDDGIPL
ncbi:MULTISPECIES: conjugal transfer protein TraG [Caulobacter]|jgi:type IV secretion system protein VirD4|uniref:Type IV secretory pathway, VirD4 component n=1 Tax=Caulobacter vibrioides OR37 TaxID=1292034 RepID=R0CZD8_CAUVI|nr:MULTISPECIES: conjugal transfer protein TraG [Caulobacter]ENZ81615.1 type IV secretory pathway, VirD4 component [Caulobacter vibrioides OR37]PIB96947.1 conjugal transfer protein TraG [Caulobacter sp. X]